MCLRWTFLLFLRQLDGFNPLVRTFTGYAVMTENMHLAEINLRNCELRSQVQSQGKLTRILFQ